MDITANIELLLKYAVKNRLIAGLDVEVSRNLLFDLLDISRPFDGQINEVINDLDAILAPILDYAFEKGLIEEDTTTRRDLFEGKIMGILTPRQSEVEATFLAIEKEQGAQAATDYFYKLSSATNYIKTTRLKKNLHWNCQTDFGELEITINLSKPEKDPRDIAKMLEAGGTSYPQCLLCVENIGFAGNINHQARQNHRIIPMRLAGEDWYLQFSPYSYYPEHCIPLYSRHRPISISGATFEKLLDFLERFPHYFVGSNTDLPIVGGSILNHDHFQGGRYTFPIEKAGVLSRYILEEVNAEIVKWPMSVIRLRSENREQLTQAATAILAKWRDYEDKSVRILPKTGDSIHNTITPIARINADGKYELYVVLRNNRTSAERPDGIFHPHPDVHHIKKENIGLIEVMGLAILPGRLKEETQLIAGYLLGEKDIAGIDAGHLLHKHKAWVVEMLSEGRAATPEQAGARIEKAIGQKFLEGLCHAGVFKTDATGHAAFQKFLASCGAREVV